MSFDQRLHDREPETAVGRVGQALKLREGLENAAQLVARNPTSIVTHRHAHALSTPGCRELEPAASRRKLRRARERVAERLRQADWMASQTGRRPRAS